MKPLASLGKIALVAVFLFGLGCSGGDNFEPAPGASIEQDELQGLITQAMSEFDLDAVAFQPLATDANAGGYKSCFEVESGPCYVPRPPGMSASFQSSDGVSVLINVMLAIDEAEAADLVDNAALSRTTTATQSLRIQYEGAPVPPERVVGPCDAKADREADGGCAWEETSAPNVGDEARAVKSEILDDHGLSMVGFCASRRLRFGRDPAAGQLSRPHGNGRRHREGRGQADQAGALAVTRNRVAGHLRGVYDSLIRDRIGTESLEFVKCLPLVVFLVAPRLQGRRR